MAQRKHQSGTRVCHHCGVENPLKAYCCLSCFKVLRPKEKIPFWKIYVRPNASVLILVGLLAGIGIYTFKKWMDNIEAQVTMNFTSADYNLSVVADKKKKQKLFGMMDLKDSSDTEEGSTVDTPPSTSPPTN